MGTTHFWTNSSSYDAKSSHGMVWERFGERMIATHGAYNTCLLHTHADWNTIPPLEYLGPFLEIIKSAEISGPVTGAALAGLHRILTAGVLGTWSRRVPALGGTGL